ncbi:peptidoglycan DD-metalloendopeptidase family protein [Sphingobium sp. HBC34]|uniref:Peptidoglycan DD-metalloendopeptidase family protein n=1 Tax=Sphingobium cyanobacteriorum TaxID=3063954 RepID=A0ABT8ZIU0_9SPHN|nr:peptidoglycan DD-metalloendopeptidase family protein [Sphingobium sp. HBC34]MDO7834448.1 peptidoglycan DD-metalloendopeptidase family protein [Sphingobium sp. HBC34]
MSHQKKKGLAGLSDRLNALCPEREIFLRSGGQVKFIRISRRAQLAAAGFLSVALIGWAGVTLSMVANNSAVAQQRAALAAQGQSVAKAAGKVADYRKSVEDLAQDLEARQDFMDDLYKTHFGTEEGNAAGADLVGPAREEKKGSLTTKISMAPEAAPLVRLEQRQRRFALLLTHAVERRADKAAAAIRSFGLNPDNLARSAARAQGGPFVPWKGEKGALTNELEHLADAMSRMEFLERSLLTIPSGRPTGSPMLTSSYGYRRDPFNGHAAFHAGLDFPGRYGQPINAAADGKVSYVGQRQGYGNVVEVDHGNGIMTRYAHLSGFAAHVGEAVARGDTIGRMGSTGRSTGTHLHFEVRLNGQAVNPRPFLEARQDVLQVQQVATARFADVRDRG